MRKLVLVIALAMVTGLAAMAQRERMVGLELGGPTNFVGLHFEQPLGKTSPFAVRTGLSYGFSHSTGEVGFIIGDEGTYAVMFNETEHQIAVPIELNYLSHRDKRHHLELGLGTSLGYYYDRWEYSDNKQSTDAFGYFCFANVGWRHEFRKHWTLRLGATVTWDFGGDNRVIHNGPIDPIYPYASLGYRF